MPVNSWEDESLDFDEVAKCFSMTVAEAANLLGVCPATLKRICRENGLSRWPHRKFLGGKSVEEIKREALRAKQQHLQEQMYNTTQPSNLAQISAAQSTMSTTRTNLRISTTATSRTKMPMPSFLDDFRHGFPSKGLESLSDHWWGASEAPQASSTPAPPSEIDKSPEPAAQLVKLRKRKAESLHKALLHSPVAFGYGASKVEGKPAEVLKFVFGEDMPKQWAYAFG